MRWKLPLLLMLCAPLGYRAWSEFDRPTAATPHVDLPPREELARKKTALQEMHTLVEARVTDEDLASCIFHISAEPPRSVPNRPRSLEPLAQSLTNHAATVREVREFARIYHELESDPSRPIEMSDADLKRWLEDRRTVVKDRKDREKDIAGALETLNGKLKAALRSRDVDDMKQAKEELDAVLVRLEKHRQTCEGFRVLATWADRRLAESRLTRDLLVLARNDAAIQKMGMREETAKHLRAYARLLEAASEEELRSLVRNEAARFCEGYVPPRMDGNAMVLYRNLEVPREHVWILWKKERPETKRYGEYVQLIRTAFDEFRPPDLDAVEHYYRKVKDGDDTFHDQIKPTPRNLTARYFNEKRKTLTWTEDALRRFLNDNPVPWTSEETMPEPFRRAEHLLESLGKQPGLLGRVE